MGLAGAMWGWPVMEVQMGMATWEWGSMPPGTTILPEASTTRPTSPGREPGAATAAILSPSTATSQSPTPQGVTTCPPLTIRSIMVHLPVS